MNDQQIAVMRALENSIQNNICRPKPHEEEKLAPTKRIRASGFMEGDSQIGLTLFVGIGTENWLYTKEVLTEFISITPEEYDYKLKKYRGHMEDKHPKYVAKTKLILNSMRFKGLPIYSL